MDNDEGRNGIVIYDIIDVDGVFEINSFIG